MSTKSVGPMLPCALAGHECRVARCSALAIVAMPEPSVAMTEPFAAMAVVVAVVVRCPAHKVLHIERTATAVLEPVVP